MLSTSLVFLICIVCQLSECFRREKNITLFPEEERFFEGDIYLRWSEDPLDRNAVTDKNARWPGATVPYLLDPAYGDEERAIIMSAMKEIEKSTCIKFVARQDQEDFIGIFSGEGLVGIDDYYTEFFESSCSENNKSYNCWSSLGRGEGLQLLSLEKPRCVLKGVAMHELMHGIGFLHEHTRPDRDDHLIIHWDNVIDEVKRNFQKVSYATLDTLNEPYDYRSVMHYHAWAFAKQRNRPTMTPTQPNFSHTSLGYGQREGKLTDLDIRKIRKFYECQITV